ncbi:MAG TPA: DUF4340 domain-containing protein [Verrucomicrobiae bacterium]|nr:DUF4340 domain-containing protein [Verrucomicrobiae bacterium]
MRAKTTWLWFTVAAALFAFVFVYNHFRRMQSPPSHAILPGFRPSDVTSIQIVPAAAFEIRADLTNGEWALTRPISYPAQTAAVQALLEALKKLTFVTPLSMAELRAHRNADADLGFENPQYSITVQTPGNRWQIYVGKKTPPGDQVFLRVVGVSGATFVTDAGWLNAIPQSAVQWRDTSLIGANGNTIDWIVLTNGAKVIELRQDAETHLWRMTRPLDARADNEKVVTGLQQLEAAQLTRFVSDNAGSDVARFGLQPADLTLWLGHGTNLVAGFSAGKSLTNDASQIYVRRKGYQAVGLANREPLSAWFGPVNSFCDPYLLDLTAMPTEIEVRGDSNYTLQRVGTNDWKVAGEKFAADSENAVMFVRILAGLRVLRFVKDYGTTPDLQAYGLLPKPTREIIVRSAVAGTNAVIADLSFAVTTNGVYVRRADENFIYSISPEDFNRLPESGWEFRDRDIWHFTEGDVAQVTLHQNGKTRVIIRNGPNKWSLAPGSQGMITPEAVEETVHRLGELSARPYGWVGHNVKNPQEYGLNTNNLEIVVELKNGEKRSVEFGASLTAQNTSLAAVTLEGERWVFIFPPPLYQLVAAYLTIPDKGP